MSRWCGALVALAGPALLLAAAATAADEVAHAAKGYGASVGKWVPPVYHCRADVNEIPVVNLNDAGNAVLSIIEWLEPGGHGS